MPALVKALPANEIPQQELEELLERKGVFPIHRGARLSKVVSPLNGRPVYIYGPVGTGKTYLAVAYLVDVLERRGEAGVAFIRAYDLMAQIRASFRPGANTDPVYSYSRYRFLIIDDLGAEKDTPTVQEALYAILDYRAGHQLSTLITSNFSLDRIAAHYGDYGDRIASRIAGMGPVLEWKGKDRRLTN